MSIFLHCPAITAAFVRVLAMDPVDAFAAHPGLRVDRATRTDDGLAQPGFIGPHYRPGSLLLVGMNPGGGSHVSMELEAVSEERALRSVLAGQMSLADAMVQMQAAKKAWPYWRNVVTPAAEAAGLDLGRIAHLNLFPFRTVGQKLPVALIRHFRPFFDDLVAALGPSIVVACGVGTGEHMAKAGLQPAVILPRTRGDNGEAPGFAAALRQIAATMAPASAA